MNQTSLKENIGSRFQVKNQESKMCGKFVDYHCNQKVLVCPVCSHDLLLNEHLYSTVHFSQQTQLSHLEKTNLLKLQQFRMVIPNLLYVIGLPRKFAQEETMRQARFFGQFGKIQRVLINHYTKDFYEQ